MVNNTVIYTFGNILSVVINCPYKKVRIDFCFVLIQQPSIRHPKSYPNIYEKGHFLGFPEPTQEGD